jgi:hypothetical protein
MERNAQRLVSRLLIHQLAMHVGTAEGARAVVLQRVPYLAVQVNEV